MNFITHCQWLKVILNLFAFLLPWKNVLKSYALKELKSNFMVKVIFSVRNSVKLQLIMTLLFSILQESCAGSCVKLLSPLPKSTSSHAASRPVPVYVWLAIYTPVFIYTLPHTHTHTQQHNHVECEEGEPHPLSVSVWVAQSASSYCLQNQGRPGDLFNHWHSVSTPVHLGPCGKPIPRPRSLSPPPKNMILVVFSHWALCLVVVPLEVTVTPLYPTSFSTSSTTPTCDWFILHISVVGQGEDRQ